jgi:hypothetical protein
MTETTETVTAYDPIPKLAWLLAAAQRLADGIDATAGVTAFARQLTEGMHLPELATAEEAEAAIRKALTETAGGGTIREGTKVRLIDPPGAKVPYGAIGIAEGEPGDGDLFWARFPQGRMDVRVCEVEIIQQGESRA